ncbi:ATP-binding protein [Terricaulis sp.]|uniref:ATP-binding protein n=1 Tax=Terricaulis sp. TaxID=2768686 RepID=UPI002AC76DBB|nr:ATP-binding protein [Terricaulis sp.]MDZ4691501.1 ATP-binding protein [Terricaulis sp.]
MNLRAGLPIAAYLGMLMAIALTAAFVATLAIVIFLPPRPPDVLRADKVAEHFQAGYDHMTALGRTMNERGVVWEVRADPPERDEDSPYMSVTQHELARLLDLPHDQVRTYADHIRTDGDMFVFRVGTVEGWTEEVISSADAERITEEVRRAHEQAEERLIAARERLEAAADARQDAEEALAEAVADAEADRVHAQHEREMALAEARVEAAQARAEEMAERQARAAERLAARLERRVRIQNGEVIVTTTPDADVDVEVNIDPPDMAEFEYGPTPLAPPTPQAPPAAPSAPTRATGAAIAPVAPVSPTPPMYAPAPAGVVLISGYEFGAQLPDGRWLVMRQGRNWAEIGWIARAALVIGGTLLLLSIAAVLFARRLTSPIRSFADAVQAVGVNPQSEPVREEGPLELRGAARAVNTMQARLRSLIADRTKTLAAVAHDMRTPLMRLRLAAENATPEQREKMAKEIDEVEALVASFIAFARDDPAEEARVRLDLTALLESIADDHVAAGRNVSFAGEERFVITGQSLGLKRLFGNLVENALKYGSSARIAARVEDGVVIVDVADDGPGIPLDQRENVFEPFVRLNEEGTRGAGLGLAAARSIARAHGGDIVILDADGGALIRVTLPA